MPIAISLPGSRESGKPVSRGNRATTSRLPAGFVEAWNQLQREQVPAVDHAPGVRAMARLMSTLRPDTPERRALFDLAGVPPGAISGEYFATLAETWLREIERRHAIDAYPFALDKALHREGEAPPKHGLNTQRLSEVIPREVEWQRPGFTALGKLTLLSGPPGVGKTWLMMDHIARLTTGRTFPGFDAPTVERLGCDPSDRRNALFVSSEDSEDDVLRPRLDLLGGDSSRVHTLSFVTAHDGKSGKWKRAGLALDRHVEHLDRWLMENPLVELVVFDPISAVLGKTDSHRDADVRAILGPLAQLADRRRVAIVGINHLTKSGEGQAMYRSMGSIAFVAAARIAWQVVSDADTPGRSLFLPVKMNLGPRPAGRAFRLGGEGLVWERDAVAVTADEALNGPSLKKREAAAEWLGDLLSDGPLPQTTVCERAKAEAFSWATIRNAKSDLRVRSERVDGHWVWTLSPGGREGAADEGAASPRTA